MVGAFLRAVDAISNAAAAAAAACLGAMTLLMLAEVVARNVFAQSLTFSWEFSGYLMGAVFFFGAAYTFRTGGHVRVSILSETLSAPAARGLEYATTLVGLAITGFLFHAILDLLLSSYSRGIKSFTPMETPLILPQGVLALGALLLLLQMVARLIRLLRGEAPDIPADEAVLGSDQ